MTTYGKLTLHRDAAVWAIDDLAPHVAIALKRLFPRIPQTSTKLKIGDTDEVRADLHWFMQRYPLDHDHQGDLTEACQRLADRNAERERILLPTWEPGVVPGFIEGRQPYLYQTQAARVAKRPTRP